MSDRSQEILGWITGALILVAIYYFNHKKESDKEGKKQTTETSLQGNNSIRNEPLSGYEQDSIMIQETARQQYFSTSEEFKIARAQFDDAIKKYPLIPKNKELYAILLVKMDDVAESPYEKNVVETLIQQVKKAIRTNQLEQDLNEEIQKATGN